MSIPGSDAPVTQFPLACLPADELTIPVNPDTNYPDDVVSLSSSLFNCLIDEFGPNGTVAADGTITTSGTAAGVENHLTDEDDSFEGQSIEAEEPSVEAQPTNKKRCKNCNRFGHYQKTCKY